MARGRTHPATYMVSVGLLATLLAPIDARAYGGLVGEADDALTQTAQRVIFHDHGDGTITAIIELSYATEGAGFAWVLPVPGVPEVGISSAAAFDRLQGLTDSSYRLDAFPHGDCEVQQPIASVGLRREEPAPVARFAEGETGPFAYEVFGPDPMLEDPVGALLGWLGAQLGSPLSDEDVLRSYVEEGFNLMALWLESAGDDGTVRPITLTYDADEMRLPLRLAAPHAGQDTPLLVWVLGSTRAVTTTHATIELDHARVDWFDPSESYHALVSEAVDEANGHGFVTEFSAGAGALAESFVLAGRDAFEQLRAGQLGDMAVLLDASVLIYGEWDGFEAAVRKAAPGAAQVPTAELLQCVSCYVEDVDVFLDALSSLVVEPMLVVHDALLASTSVTRLYTRVDGSDMDVDPRFALNADVEAMLGQNIGRGSLTCDYTFDVTLPGGTRVRGTWGQWPARDDLPAARRILRYAADGSVEVLEDHGELIDDAFAPAEPPPDGGMPTPAPGAVADAGVDADGGGTSDRRADSGCAVGAGAGPAGTPVWLLAALWLVARRRGARTRQ